MEDIRSSVECSAPDNGDMVSSSFDSTDTSSSIDAAIASPTIPSSSPSASTSEDDEEDSAIMALLKHELEMAFNQSDDSLQWYGHKMLPPIPEEDENGNTESSALQDLPKKAHGSHGALNDRATENEGWEDDRADSVAAVAAAATGDAEIQDLAMVPSTADNGVPIQPLDAGKDVLLRKSEEIPLEPADEQYDVPLYDSFGFFAESILDLVPLSPVTTPYSWMFENPGQVPEAVIPPVQKEWCNIEGEKEVEVAIKTFATTPQTYFLMATCVKCLVRFRHDKLIGEQACASLLFRCVNGDARLWDPIKDAFVSKDFDIVRFPKLCTKYQSMNKAVAHLYDIVKKPYTVSFTKTLARLIEAVLVNCRMDCYLMHTKTGKTVADNQKHQGGLDISEDFMGRFGSPWPFYQMTPTQADVYGLGEPLAFEEVFGGAEYLAREKAILKNAMEAKGRSRWRYPIEELSRYLNDLYEDV